MTEPAEPGFMDRLRARFGWFDRVMIAQGRYNDSKGDFYAAGITYFTIFALFPLLMVGFAVIGFVLYGSPDLLAQLQAKIQGAVSGDLGKQLLQLIDTAIKERTSVGLIGLATATWAGLGWMANLREALSQMWGLQRGEPLGFLRTKLSDLLALLSAFAAIIVTAALTALGNGTVIRKILQFFHVPDFPMLGILLQVASHVASLAVSWLLFTWIIARLPRESVGLRSAARAGLLAAVAFEIFKQVASLYLKSVVGGPAGSTFGPIIGLMVFAYITARLILFATAWAATSPESLLAAPVGPPDPAEITTRVEVREGLGVGGVLAAAGAGALGTLGLSRLTRRR
ncbi:inner membrane protein YhjD [Mycolicibacterium madagascariense]|uniref:Inner membrane protein YhjD n=1 Tax=Mycolicibacterium madagascariense TaxID=212765 RepID=A0A7I7XBQ0_9MYCO|nr:inner membrane protein YhjD [Mycolicibacterium madagascariense]MCV7013577.1 inner membrane protein YhjD [Mycolicibacterium madagascariense]BBZ27024.1 inner membrane protein YhjD [Mycolicibacterium madagascariense]